MPTTTYVIYSTRWLELVMTDGASAAPNNNIVINNSNAPEVSSGRRRGPTVVGDGRGRGPTLVGDGRGRGPTLVGDDADGGGGGRDRTSTISFAQVG